MKLNLRKGIYSGKWVDIRGYEGKYQVSNLGQVRSLSYGRSKNIKIRKLTNNGNGYMKIGLWKNNKGKEIYIHRLVAQAFIPNPDDKPEVDHINTIKSNNRLWNLKWVSYSENNNNLLTLRHMSDAKKGKPLSEEHKRRIGESGKKKWQNEEYRNKMTGENHWNYGKHHSEETKQKMRDNHADLKGSKHSKAKKIYCIELNKSWDSITECAEELGLNRANIISCCKGRQKTVKGYHFKYSNEQENNNL